MQPLGLIHRKRQILPAILEPHRQLIERLIQRLQLVRVGPLKGPIQSLWRHVGRGDDADVGVDEEEPESFQAALPAPVEDVKAVVAVLDCARPDDHAAFVAADYAGFLDSGVANIKAEDLLEPDGVVMVVLDLGEGGCFSDVPEGHGGNFGVFYRQCEEG